MSLYSNWNDMVVEYVKSKGEKAFWDEYSQIETKIYKVVLGEHKNIIQGKIEDLTTKFGVSIDFFVGFVDGINESLKTSIDLEAMDKETEIVLDVDFEKLYFNMVDASADYLYNLEQWESIFSQAKRDEIKKDWKRSKTIRNDDKVGRNDSCPCGSGKKYKKCCGK